MLSFNVAELLRSRPGTSRDLPLIADSLVIADDLVSAAPVQGRVRLSTTGRGIIARAHVTTALPGTCDRCLTATVSPVEADFTEEALPTVDIDSGQRSPIERDADEAYLLVDDHHELDLTGAVREAVSLAEPIVVLCRPDCLGLCLTCGAELNSDPDHTHGEDDTDPRFAALVAIRDQLHT